MNMPIGVITDCSAVLLGSLIGGTIGNKLKKELCNNITSIFGICSISMGIISIVKINNLPPVILAVIVGTLLGEITHLEVKVSNIIGKLKTPIAKIFKYNSDVDEEIFMSKFISVAVLFCASGTGIFGALESGLSGDNTILFSKAILDFFTSIIFSASLGYIIIIIAIPQFIVLLSLFIMSTLIMPFVSSTMLNDFTACGGILLLATGFRISEIKKINIVNMLPAMFFVMIFSYIWTSLI